MDEPTTFAEYLNKYKPENMPEYTEQEKESQIINWLPNCTNFYQNVKTGYINIFLLNTDPAYKRDIIGYHYVLTEFDSKKVQPIIINIRKNKAYIIDGQHVVIAAAANGLLYLPCLVYTGLTQAEEACIMLSVNQPKPLTPTLLFQANYIAGRQIEKDIIDICQKYNIDPLTDKNISVSATINIISDPNGKNCLDWVLNVIQQLPWLTNQKNNYPLMYALKQVFHKGTQNGLLTEYRNNILSVCQITSMPVILSYGSTQTNKKDNKEICKAAILNIAQGICNKETLKEFLL